MKTKKKTPPSNISAPGHDRIPNAVVLAYAQRIAEALAEKHFKSAVPFEVFGDLWGVLEQIDNMTCGMIREHKPLGKAGHSSPLTPRPWAWMFHQEGSRFGLCTLDGKTDVLLATDQGERVIIEIGERDAEFLIAAVNAYKP